MRSRRGPETRFRYRVTREGSQVHRSRSPSPKNPHGQGFMAATRTNREGNRREIRARGQNHVAVLQGLAKGLEDVPPELRELVQEEDAVMGQAHLPGTGDSPTPDQTPVADGVVGGPEGTTRAAEALPGQGPRPRNGSG